MTPNKYLLLLFVHSSLIWLQEFNKLFYIKNYLVNIILKHSEIVTDSNVTYKWHGINNYNYYIKIFLTVSKCGMLVLA